MTRPIARRTALVLAISAAGPGCDTRRLDVLAADDVLPGDPIAVSADGRVHVMVSVDEVVTVASGDPGGDWTLEPIVGAASSTIDVATLAASGESLHAVWGPQTHSQVPDAVYYSQRAANGAWSEPVDLLARLPLEMRWPSSAHVVASSTGTVTLLWGSRKPGFYTAEIVDGRLVGVPQLVTVTDATASCHLVSRPALDNHDRLVAVAHCSLPTEQEWEYRHATYLVRDAGDRWQVDAVSAGGADHVALGPDNVVHIVSLPGWICDTEDSCPQYSPVLYADGAPDTWRDAARLGTSATAHPATIAVDADGAVYVAYQGSRSGDDSAPCEEDGEGCLVTSADGTRFGAPSELPGLPLVPLRSSGGRAMAARGRGAVLVDCLTSADSRGCHVAVSTLEP